MTGALLLVVSLALAPMQETADAPPRIDFDAAIKEAAARVVAEDAGFLLALQERDPATGQFVAAEDERGFWTMSKDGLTEPAQLMFLAASVADIWSRAEVTRLCEDSADVLTCSNTGLSASVDSLMTAGVTMGVTGIQRLAKKYWDVDLDESWKQYAIWGGLSAVRLAATWSQVSLANDIRGAQGVGAGLTFNVGGG